MQTVPGQAVRSVLILSMCIVAFVRADGAFAWSPLPVVDDPLLRMPGTQPGQVELDAPDQCLNCHDGFDASTEPGAWQGSMMGQASRDPLFWAAMTVAAQDSIWALGRPNATDLCLRCHFPQGWLEGRSDPTNASLMQGSDHDGVHCVHCHRLVDPFFEATYEGVREGSDWADYWDETNQSGTPSADAAYDAHELDEDLSLTIELFNGAGFFDGETHAPGSPDYTENGGGQYFVDTNTARRGPFADAEASHHMVYSRYHKSRYYCSTCHDVSNPVLANLDFAGTAPGDGSTVLPSEQLSSFRYGHVERTFSEFMLSAFGEQGGAPGTGEYAPGVFSTPLANDYIARCQDCHMPDVPGRAASQAKAIERPVESVEHPESGVPSHDMTGGNHWVPWVLASTVPESPNFDAENQSILGQGPDVLTLDLAAGLGLDFQTLLDAANRALVTLSRAATIEQAAFDEQTNTVSFRVRNHTGHKLLSGFPEGRRAWVNVRVFDAQDQLISEINPYDFPASTLKGLSYPYGDPDGILPAPLPLGAHEHHEDELVYEMVPSSTLTGEVHSFHFVLADGRYKDNRIPPQGFRSSEAVDRLVDPAWDGSAAPGLFTAEEYQGGYDQVQVPVDPAGRRLEIRLYYQTTSREYIEFLRDEINGTAATLPGAGAAGDPAYVAQSDPFFDRLRAWGDAIWRLWRHNRSVPGAGPILLAEAVVDIPASGEPAIDIEKSTNTFDADVPPGPYIAVGDTVEWLYHVTNTGDTRLTGIEVLDDQGVTVDCPGSELEAGDTMTCSASGVMVAGQYANVGTVTGTPPDGLPAVGDNDASHYFGMVASIDLEKATNGEDADTAPGPSIAVGDPVSWTYRVRNTSNVDLTDITVTDDQGVLVSCPHTALEAGREMTCTGTGSATEGPYQNVGSVTAQPPVGPVVADSDVSHYLGTVEVELIFANGFE